MELQVIIIYGVQGMLLQVTLCMASNYITPNMAYTGKGRAEMARRREVACKKYVFYRVFLSKQPSSALRRLDYYMYSRNQVKYLS